jgi:hypothetical protein
VSDDYWSEIDKLQSFTAFISKDAILCEKRSLHMIKETGYLPFNTEEILFGYTSSIQKLHQGLTEIQQIDYVPDQKGSDVSVCLLKYKLPSFKNRDFLISFSVKYIDSSTCMLIAKNTQHLKSINTPGHIRGTMNFCIIVESKQEMNLSKVTFVSLIDLNGEISTKLYNQALHKRKLHLLPKLNEIILERKSNNEKRPNEHFRILDTLEEISTFENEEKSAAKMKLALLNILISNTRFQEMKSTPESSLIEDNINVLIANPNVKKAFRLYCEKEWSLENLLLFEEIDEIPRLRSNSKKISKINFICESYFSKDSEKEVNIDFETRNILKKKLENVELNSNLDDFFDEVEKVIKRNLRDSMNRFLFSEEFKALNVKVDRKSVTKSRKNSVQEKVPISEILEE